MTARTDPPTGDGPGDGPGAEDVGRRLDLVARRERGRLIAGLVHRLGNRHLALAEDVAQDALLTALAVWPYRGMPDNPGAWLARVARNRALDRLRRENREEAWEEARDTRTVAADDPPADARIADRELRLMFLCCNPALAAMDRLALTLRVVSGFTAREIAGIFLSTEAAIAQRLARSKRRLRRLDAADLETPGAAGIDARLPAVLKVVYLMFGLGYAPRSGARLIRRDVAAEALRLARELADRPQAATPAAAALAALLCFQASRLDAREDADGRPVLFRDQDRRRWDAALIDRGIGYLRAARAGAEVTRYHLEAGIASLYALAPSWEEIDWPAILSLYALLGASVDSPVVTINRCVARAFAGDPAPALADLDRLAGDTLLRDYAPLHIARAEILRLLDRESEARASFRRAIDSGASAPVLLHLEARLSGGA